MGNFEDQGRKAFRDGYGADACPYAFSNTPCWETKDYERFDREYRHKLNEWMKGWIKAKGEHL